jgi:type I restriction enzyme S subunit
MVTLKSFDRNGGYRPEGLKPYIGPFKPTQVLRQGEIAVAQTDLTQGAEVVGRTIRVPRVSEFDTLVASLDLIIVRPRNGVSSEFLYGLLSTADFREHCRSRTSGTTVLHLGSDALSSFLVALPPLAAQAEFAELAAPLLANSDRLGAETAYLTALRDALLPELLSGRLRVREVEEMVGSV